MSHFNRHNPWVEPKQTSNTIRYQFYDDDDDTSNMQMARRSQQPSRSSQSTFNAPTRPIERNRATKRVESWRDEKHGDDLSGAMSRMRVSGQTTAAPRPHSRPRSPSPEPSFPPRRREREDPRRQAQRQRAPSPPPTRQRPSPPPTRNRRAPSPNWNSDEQVRIHQPRRAAAAPQSPSPPPARRQRSPSPFDNLFDNFCIRQHARSPLRLNDDTPTRSLTHPFSSNNNSYSSYSFTTSASAYNGRTSSCTTSSVNGRRTCDTYRTTHHSCHAGTQHDPGCPFCFEAQGEAARAAAEWCAEGEKCWVEWDPHGWGLWGVVFDIGRGGGGGSGGGFGRGGELWIS